MSRLYIDRTLLGNIALVVLLSLLMTMTLGMLHPAPAMSVTLTEDPNLDIKVDAQKKAAIEDKSGNWAMDGNTAELITNKGKTEVDLTVQVLTDSQFDQVLLYITGIGELSGVSNAVYKKVYGTVYYVYQFVYKWVYSSGLSIDKPNDYILQVYSSGENLATITLDLEAPPPDPVPTPTPGSGTPPVSTEVGTIVTDGKKAILTIDRNKIASLLADTKLTKINFAISMDRASQQGSIEVTADILTSIFEARKLVLIDAVGAQLTLPPGSVDLSVFKGENVNLKINVSKGQAATPGTDAYRLASDAYTITIRADVSGVDKGGISTLSKPITLTLPYDATKLTGTSEDYLGIYRLNGSKWDYVGGKINRSAGTISATRSSLSTYAVMAYDKVFTDMAGHWAESDVKLMAARHITTGYTDTTFVPNGNVTRAQFAAFLLRAMNIDVQKATGKSFKDVPADAWHAGIVEAAAANRLVNGYPDGTFKPNAQITREELATMVTRALDVDGKGVTLTDSEVNAQLARFKDAGQVSNWARTSMAVAIKEGIVKGRSANECVPKANANRAEGIVMIKRFLAATDSL